MLAAPDSELAAMRQQLADQQLVIEQQQGQLSAIQQQLNSLVGNKTATAHASPPIPDQTPVHVGTEKREVAKKEKLPDITVLDQNTGVMLKRGSVVVEPGLEYSNSSAVRVDIQGYTIIPALNIGLFQISDVNRDAITARLTGRMGITNRLEADISVPYLYRNDRTRARPFGAGAGADVLTEVDGSDIGDIEFGAHYQINSGRNEWPIFIANARYKSDTGTGPFDVPRDPATGLLEELPTGSGFTALEPSVTAIFPNDPVVFFANLGYTYNMEEDIGGTIGTIDPGDSVNATLGSSLAINDRTSLSLSYTHNMVFESTQNGTTIPDSTILQVGALNIGSSYRATDATAINFITSVGVTEDAPDVRLIVKVPMTFDLF
ncbi:MAG: hypothetical protein AB7G06_06700 [Bdellovibrionales bacterium]